MDPELFRDDLAAKPEGFARLAALLRRGDVWRGSSIDVHSRVVLLGMGSSHYANGVAAARLRARGIDAVAELASSDLLPEPRPGTVVVAVSASGGSVETLAGVTRYVGRAPIVAVTNVEGSAVTDSAGHVVHMAAGEERGGVACRSFAHTLALLLDLEDRLVGGVHSADLLERCAVAAADLLDRSGDWLPELSPLVIGPEGTHLAAPARRLSSAQQGALMLREGPRRAAVGCETGDWSHVDVYLTKTTDYRLVLFSGSRWEPELLRWVRERGSTLVSIGADNAEAAACLRYRHDDDDHVALLTEVTVPELLASRAWA